MEIAGGDRVAAAAAAAALPSAGVPIVPEGRGRPPASAELRDASTTRSSRD